MKTTLDDIESAINQIPMLVDKINTLEIELSKFKEQALYKDVLSVKELALYLDMSERTARTIMEEAGASKVNNKYYIQRNDLNIYLQRYKKFSRADVDKAADNYLLYGKKKKKSA